MKSNRLAIEALRAEVKKIAFDANLFDKGMADYPHAQRCSERRKILLAEIERLKAPQQLGLSMK